MGLRGQFKDFSIADIVQLIFYQKKTGKLTIHIGDQSYVLGFEKGMLIYASAERQGPRLGEILVRQGYIDRETLVQALRDQEKVPRHLGQVLEEMGKVSRSDIGRALSFQIQETALNLFFQTDGDYLFEKLPVSYDEAYTTPINTEFILMEGARRVDEWPQIQRLVKGGDTRFMAAGEVGEAALAALSPSQIAVLSLVDGKRSVTDLVAGLGLGLFETCRILADLASQRLIVTELPGSAPFRDPVSGIVIGSPAPGTPSFSR